MTTQQINSRSAEKVPRWPLGSSAERVSFESANKKHKKVCKWLRDHTSNLDYGTKWRGKVVHCNTNRESVAFLLRQRNWLGRIRNKDFAQHFSGQDTFYFAGSRSGYSLVMLDIDCHKRGSLDGAKELSENLRQFFPNLYSEVSTNGNGGHGYFLVEAKSESNSELKRLEKALDTWLACHPHDVEFVEIKGLAPTVTIENRRLTNYKAGTLAKVPREADVRFEELTATTTLTLAELKKVIDQIESDCSKPGPVPPLGMQIVAKPTIESPKKKALGSISGKHINTDQLEKYEWFAGQLLGDQEIKTTGKHKVTITDIAICLMILRFCSKNMNLDGTLPTARIKAFWDNLYSCGDVSRPWNAKRYAAIRNWLSSLGVIDWADETYRLGCGDDKGQAAKWKFNDTLLAVLDGLAEEREEKEDIETSFIDTVIQSSSYLRPRQVWIDCISNKSNLKMIEMMNQVMLLYDQAA